MKLTYTDSGKTAKEEFIREQVRLLEDRIRRSKYVFGDEEIEVTATDVKMAATPMRYFSTNVIFPFTTLISEIFIAAGSFLLAYGIYYNKLREIFETNPIQLLYIGSGVLMLILGGVAMALKKRRLRDEQRMYAEMSEKLAKVSVILGETESVLTPKDSTPGEHK